MTVEQPPKAKAATAHASAVFIASSPKPKSNVIQKGEYGNAVRANGD
jgi:hypothetical protein